MDLIKDLYASIQLSGALTDVVDGVSSQVTTMLPIGIQLMGILAAPGIIKRIFRTFT